MANFTNFDPVDIPNTGLDISAGTSRHDVLTAIVDEILSIGGNEFGEITTGSPPHANLGQYGGVNITAAGTALTADGTLRHRTLYFKNDPLISSGYARMIRFCAGYGVMCAILDSRFGNSPPSDDIDWLPVPLRATNVGSVPLKNGLSDVLADLGNSITSYISIYDQIFAFLFSTGIGASTSTTTVVAQKVFIWGGNDWLYIRSHRTSDLQIAGNAYIFAIEPVNVGWTRAQRPSIAAIQFDNTTAQSNSGDSSGWRFNIGVPGDGTIGIDIDNGSYQAEAAKNIDKKTPSNEEFLSKVIAWSNNGGAKQFFGYVPGLRVVRSGAAISIDDEATINSQLYHCVADNTTYKFLVEAVSI